MRLAIRLTIWLAAALVPAYLLTVVAVRKYQPPPTDTLNRALQAFTAAGAADAEPSASETYRQAEVCLDRGQKIMKEIAASWWPFHSYDLADSLLKQSIRYSHLADSLAHHTRISLKDRTATKLADLADSLAFWHHVMDSLLPRVTDLATYRAAEVRAQLARELAAVGQYELAGMYGDTVRTLLDSLERSFQQRLTIRRERIPLWDSWVAATIDSSRLTGKHAIIVDKADHRLYVLRKGHVVDSFRCDLGYNSGHQKQRAGDGATPEGMYRATKVNNSSKYYRALLLDYPNADDRARFASARKAGTIPKNAKIGGLIEIHGHGALDRDWTDGCVAVSDADMDKLLRVVGVGTIVTVVREWEEQL